MISGTNGLLGAADGAFLLQKEKRTGNTATLEVSGRDQQDQKLKAENQMLWVQCMNNIRNRATEIVSTDLIYA